MKPIHWLLIAGALAGCSTTPLPPAPPAAPAPAPVPEAAVAAPAPAPAPVASGPSFTDLKAQLDGKSVYFDFDRFVVRDDQQPVVIGHAKLANDFAADAVTIQGNCDERGSSEYNLALGQKRAEAVKRSLVLLGVQEARIETVSFGKEKPRALCHTESCWSQNRRADFVDALK